MDGYSHIAKGIMKLVCSQIIIDNEMEIKLSLDIEQYLKNCHEQKSKRKKDLLHRRIEMYIFAKQADGLQDRTLHDYRQKLTAFGHFINKPVNKISTDDIRGYINHLQEKDFKISSVSNHINVLKGFFSWLQAEEIINKNPMVKIKGLAKVNKYELREGLSYEEINRMRDFCLTVRERAIFELFFSSGCRVSELVSINIPDVDFQERKITVIGKGNKRRVVFFSETARRFLKEYLSIRADEESALFVSNRRPYERLQKRRIQMIINNIGLCAGVEAYPHKLRHSFGFHALYEGMQLEAIQQLLGHSDINTTQIYAKMSLDKTRKQYDKIKF